MHENLRLSFSKNQRVKFVKTCLLTELQIFKCFFFLRILMFRMRKDSVPVVKHLLHWKPPLHDRKLIIMRIQFSVNTAWRFLNSWIIETFFSLIQLSQKFLRWSIICESHKFVWQLYKSRQYCGVCKKVWHPTDKGNWVWNQCGHYLFLCIPSSVILKY